MCTLGSISFLSDALHRFMLRKLYALVASSCCADNPDSPQHQEVLLPGHLYGMIIKERMDEILGNIRSTIRIDVRNGAAVDFNDSECYHCFLLFGIVSFRREVLYEGLVESQL